jgi:type I restriction enzyme R subunit
MMKKLVVIRMAEKKNAFNCPGAPYHSKWTDEDKIRRQIAELPDIVSKDIAYQNAMKISDAQNARDESDRATMEAILATMSSGIELYKHITSNESLKKWIQDMVFNTTYKSPSKRDEHKK